MGKRLNGQHSIIELSVMVMMGAIVAVPMQIPDRAISQGFFVLFTTLFLLRSVNWLGFKSSPFEKKVHGEVVTLVKDGVLQKKERSATRITNQQVFGVLRSKDIYNLGSVKRMYLETCGVFSVYRYPQPNPGLPLYAKEDPELSGTADPPSQEKVCTN